MFTCGWRRSSDSAKATRSSSVLTGAVMLTLFVTSSNETFPRPRQMPLSLSAPCGLLGALDWAGGAPATGRRAGRGAARAAGLLRRDAAHHARADLLGDRRGALVVEAHDTRLQRLRLRAQGDVRLRVDDEDAVAVFGGGEALRGEDRLQRDVPRLVLDLGVDANRRDGRAGDDRAAGERRERGEHVADVRLLIGHGDAGLLRALLRLLHDGAAAIVGTLAARRVLGDALLGHWLLGHGLLGDARLRGGITGDRGIARRDVPGLWARSAGVPCGELRRAVGRDGDANLAAFLGDLVAARAVEIDDDAHRVLAVLRDADVGDGASRHAIVAARSDAERGTGDVEHDAVGGAEREVGDFDGPRDSDHELGAARGRHHTERGYRPFSGIRCDRRGVGAEREGSSNDDGQKALHLKPHLS
jgi:hypothetical protein